MPQTFNDMTFLQSATEGNGDKPELSQHTNGLNEAYMTLLAGIIGDYSKTKVAFLNMAVEGERDMFEEILNSPDIKIISKEGQFSSEEFKDRDSYSKEVGYRMLVIYKKNDYTYACDKMSEYVDTLKAREPKITNPGGMYELINAWDRFIMTMPVTEKHKGGVVAKKMLDFIEEIKKDNTVDMTKTDAESEELAKKMAARYTLSDDLSLKNTTGGSNSGGQSDKSGGSDEFTAANVITVAELFSEEDNDE